MAMFIDPSDALNRSELLKNFGDAVRQPVSMQAADAAAKGIVGGLNTGGALPPGSLVGTGVQDRLSRLLTSLRGAGGAAGRFVGGALKTIPGAGLVVEGAGDIVSGDSPTAGVVRAAVGGASLFGGALPRALAGGMAGGELAAQGVAAVADRGEQTLSPSFAKEVAAAGGTKGFVSGVESKQDDELKRLAVQDAAAQKVTDARTARVNAVIADSQAQRATEAQQTAQAARAQGIADRRAQVEQQISALPPPTMARGFGNLARSFQDVGNYVLQRGALNRQAKTLATAEEKELDRTLTRSEGEANRGFNREKLLADFRMKLAEQAQKQNNIKIATVESLEGGKQSVLVREGTGEAVAALRPDKQGRTISVGVPTKPSESEAVAAAKTQLDALPASKRAAEKKRLNDWLKENGYTSQL